MSPEPIPLNQYNCNDDHWWSGRTAFLLDDIESGPGTPPKKGEQVTIIRKMAGGKQVGHTIEIDFQVRHTSGPGRFTVPCTSLSLIDDPEGADG